MLARLVAALAIVCASVAVTPVADAQPRGERGRGHQSQRHRRGRSRGYNDNYNPIPGILGGIFGGWLAGKAQQDEEDDGHDAMKNRLK